jgi:hypothetical protein
MENDVEEDVLANSYFEEPRWPLNHVLAWIAFRNIGALRATYDEIRSLGYRASIYGVNGDALIIKNPLAELRKALRDGKIKALGRNHADLPPEFWDLVSMKRETWPNVRFRREEVLALYPGAGSPPAPTTLIGSLEHTAPTVATLESMASTIAALAPHPPAGAQTNVKTKAAKTNLADSVAKELAILYGETRPAMKRDEMIRDLERLPRVGKVSPQTLNRALKSLGWNKTSSQF